MVEHGVPTLNQEGGLITRTIPAKQRRLLASIGRDLSLLMDAHAEAENNAERQELPFLNANLRSCFALANRIHRRRKAAEKMLRKAGAK